MNINRSYHSNTRISIIISFVILLSLTVYLTFVLYDAKAQSEGSTKISDKIIMHFHPNLNVTIDGKPSNVPALIGINSSLWKYHDLDKYGMKSMNMVMPAMAPLHTMDNSSNIYVGTSVDRKYTLGEFLKIWGIDLNGKSVKLSINDQPISDWRNHILSNGEQMNLEIRG